MKQKSKKYLFIIILAFFIIIQFFQPSKNEMGVGNKHIVNDVEVPANIKNLLSVSCFDCHSNQTNYKWYHKIAPVSWMIDCHIKEGKSELNFSDWQSMDVYDKIAMLDEMGEEISEKKMPLKAYTFIHQDAKLSAAQIKTIKDWIDNYSEKLLKEAE